MTGMAGLLLSSDQSGHISLYDDFGFSEPYKAARLCFGRYP